MTETIKLMKMAKVFFTRPLYGPTDDDTRKICFYLLHWAWWFLYCFTYVMRSKLVP